MCMFTISTLISGASYEQALTLARKFLPAVHLTRLSLSLNYSVFCYEISDSVALALSSAQESFDTAIVHVEHISEEQYSECTRILELLRDNIQMWKKLLVESEHAQQR